MEEKKIIEEKAIEWCKKHSVKEDFISDMVNAYIAGYYRE